MKLNNLIPVLVFTAFAASCSRAITSKVDAPCHVPERAVAQIGGTAAYQYRDHAAPPKRESYSAVLIGQRWFFRDNSPEHSYTPGLLPVSIYEDGKWHVI